MEDAKTTRDRRFIIPGALLLGTAALKIVTMFLTPGLGFSTGHATEFAMLWLGRIYYVNIGLFLSVFALMIVVTRKKRLVSWFIVALAIVLVFPVIDLIGAPLMISESGLRFYLGVETCVSLIVLPSFAYGLYLLIKNQATRALFIGACAINVVKLLGPSLPLANSLKQALTASTSLADIILFICFGLVLILMPPEKQISD